MKKVLSIILSLVMVFTMSATAFAAEVEQPAVRESSTTYTGETFYYNAETGEAIAENGEPYAFQEYDLKYRLQLQKMEFLRQETFSSGI